MVVVIVETMALEVAVAVVLKMVIAMEGKSKADGRCGSGGWARGWDGREGSGGSGGDGGWRQWRRRW